jgi:type I restriction enzyme R subunit
MAGLAANEALASSVQVNTPENARLTFEHVVNDMLQSTIDSNFKFYKRISDDDAFARFFIGRLFEEYLRSRREGGEGGSGAVHT